MDVRRHDNSERDELQQELWEKTEAVEEATRRIASYEDQIAAIIAKKDEEIKLRDSKIFDMHEQQAALSARLDNMTKESSSVTETLSSLRILVKDRDELENIAAEVQKENDSLVDDLMSKEKEMQVVREQLGESAIKLKQRERDYRKLEEELKKAQAEMVSMEMKSQEDMEYILQEVNDLNVRNAELEEQQKNAAIAEEVKGGTYNNVDKAVSEQLHKLQRDVETKDRDKVSY